MAQDLFLFNASIYDNIAYARPDATREEVYAAFTPSQHEELEHINAFAIPGWVEPADLAQKWPQIRELALELLPDDAELIDIMHRAGAVTEPTDVHVDGELLEKGLRYHPFMKSRLLLTHLFPMMGLDIMDFVN